MTLRFYYLYVAYYSRFILTGFFDDVFVEVVSFEAVCDSLQLGAIGGALLVGTVGAIPDIALTLHFPGFVQANDFVPVQVALIIEAPAARDDCPSGTAARDSNSITPSLHFPRLFFRKWVRKSKNFAFTSR